MARPKKFRILLEEVTLPDNARKVAGHVAEIEFFRKQIKDLQENIADIYDAAEDDGFDKKYIRLAVARRAKDPDAARTVEAGVDAYEEAIDLGFVSRARVENPAHDEDGEIIEDNEPADREHITGSVGKEFPNNEPAPPATPEVAADAGNDPASEAEEPGPDSSAPNPIEAPRGVEGEAEGASASPANTNNIVRISSKPLRPYCQHQDDFTKCGGYGHTHCANCAKLKRAAEINVVAGGTEIPHQGDVA